MTGRVLVTGGAGFIGSHLVDLLVASGEKVTVLDDFSTGNHEHLGGHPEAELRVVEGSILDPVRAAEAIEGCDRVYHLAVQCVRRSLGNPRESHDVNATGTLTMLEAARQAGVKRFVYCSSSEVYGNASTGLLDEETTVCAPVTVYGGAKLAGELYASAYHQTYGLPVAIVRPFNAYGPRAPYQGMRAEVIPRFVIRALAGLPPVIFGDGRNGRDFTYVTDVARGIHLAGSLDATVGRKVNIAYGRMITVHEVAEAILRATGRNDLSVTAAPPRPGDVHQLHADTRLATDLIGYTAGIPFDEGLSRYVEWFKARHPEPAALVEEHIENWTMPPSGARRQE